MSRKGLKKISGFDWPKIADKVFKTYKEALK
jgi:hypothetical protein